MATALAIAGAQAEGALAYGTVIATGRPERYPLAPGSDVSTARWFRAAMRTGSGEDFHVCDVEAAQLLGNAPVATYSTAVRAGVYSSNTARHSA